jgi:hypothetical protein
MIDSAPKTHSCATLNRCASDAPKGEAELPSRASSKASRQALLKQGGLRSVIRGKDHDS